MTVSRRTFIASAAAGSVLAAVGAAKLVTDKSAPATTVKLAAAEASAPGDVVGKITVGYQGWFACIGDGAPIDAWWHWSTNEGQPPSPSNNVIKAWPDMSEYTSVFQTAYAPLGTGAPATLFSSFDQQTVSTHFKWMQQNGCDTAALQRFDPNTAEGPTRNAVTALVNTAAQAYDRKFYIMYDATGWTNMQTEMPADWTANMSKYVSSSAYAHQNGKPVVGIWGFGFNDAQHPWSAAACQSVINFFEGQGCYVMGGVPTYWRTGVNDSRAGYLSVYDSFNMISPWMVGRIGSAADSDSFYTNVNVGDQAYCNAHSLDYQPCVLPGDVSGNQRANGTFMWEQFYNMVRVGAQGIYISMFDEFGEGNQIAKTAASLSGVPVGSGLLALNEGGQACSTDFYLRITNDGGRMLKGEIALTKVLPTPPIATSGGGDTVTVTSPGSQAGTVGTAVSVQVHGADSASGQTLAYSAAGLPAGLSISSSGLISGTPTTAATSNVTVTATDTTGASGSAVFTWTISGGGSGACGELAANVSLASNQSLASCNGTYKLTMQSDGNLVLYQGSTPLWASNTVGSGADKAILQGDGNFVLYTSSGAPVWASNTAGNTGAYLNVQNDGNVVIYSASGSVLWSTNTAGK